MLRLESCKTKALPKGPVKNFKKLEMCKFEVETGQSGIVWTKTLLSPKLGQVDQGGCLGAP